MSQEHGGGRRDDDHKTHRLVIVLKMCVLAQYSQVAYTWKVSLMFFFSYFLSVPLPPTPTSMVNDDQDNVDDAMLCSLHLFPRIHDQPFNKQFVSV